MGIDWKAAGISLVLVLLLGIVATVLVAGRPRQPTPPPRPAPPAALTNPRVVWVETTYVNEDKNKTVRYELRMADSVAVFVRIPRARVDKQGVETSVSSLDQWLLATSPGKTEKDLNDLRGRLVPYLNGLAIAGVRPFSIQTLPTSNAEMDELVFHYHLGRTSASKDAWTMLLGRPGVLGAHRPVTFTIGTEQGHTLATEFDSIDPLSTSSQLQLMVVSEWWQWMLGAFALLVVWFVYKTQTSDILRDEATVGEGKRRPYSLARVQMAVWLFIVIGVYILIWLITQDRSDLPGSVLVLIGLSSGTTVGALVIDGQRRARRAILDAEIPTLQQHISRLQTQVAAAASPELAKQLLDAETRLNTLTTERTALPNAEHSSAGFIDDVLSDGQGVSLHRLQIAVWTLTLALIFIVTAWRTLAMPEFSEGLLGLMGISAGTYLGFKGTERG